MSNTILSKCDSLLYFGYGSNMLTKRMHINCSSARKKCIAKLKNFKFTFHGYAEAWKGATATIVESPGDLVWGIVWEMSKEQEPILDRQEGGYKPIEVKVESSDGSEILCKCYQKLNMTDEYHCPSLVYKTVIINGAKEHQLPSNYIKQLEAMKDNGYKGEVEIPVNIEL